MDTVAIVAFSFALRGIDEEPNPCNIRLAAEVRRLAEQYETSIVVAQWEIARALQLHGRRITHTVDLQPDGKYLDSEAVWHEAETIIRMLGITRVIAVAQPFLQLPVVKQMIRRDGYEVLDEKIRKIGFDESPLNTQPWTTSASALLWYAVKLKFGSQHGHRGQQTA